MHTGGSTQIKNALRAAMTLFMVCLWGTFHGAAVPAGAGLAVTAGAVYAVGVSGAYKYLRPSSRTVEGSLFLYRVNGGGVIHIHRDAPAERLVLGSNMLGHVASFVKDPVKEISSAVGYLPDTSQREYGDERNGPKPYLASNFFINVSLINPGLGVSVKYRF